MCTAQNAYFVMIYLRSWQTLSWCGIIYLHLADSLERVLFFWKVRVRLKENINTDSTGVLGFGFFFTKVFPDDVIAAADCLTDSFRSTTWGPLVFMPVWLTREWHQWELIYVPSGNASVIDRQNTMRNNVFEPEKNLLFFSWSSCPHSPRPFLKPLLGVLFCRIYWA